MKIRYTFLGGLLMSCLIPALPAQAAPVQFDISDDFNADVIVNGTSGNLDTTQSPLDNVSYSLATQGGLDEGCGAGDWKGLPNNGLFAKNGNHPKVQLAYRNSNSGNNARRSVVDDQFSFSVPHAKYKRIHLLATSGDGASDVKVTFTYTDDSTTVKNFTIGDWFQPPVNGTYSLIDKMDRMNPAATECDDSPTNASSARVFGKSLEPNKNKTLKKMAVERVPGAEYSILNTFGATGVKA